MARSDQKTKTAAPPARKPKRAAPKVPRIVQIGQRLGRMIPEEERKRFPKDLISQIDHYVYGTPKKREAAKTKGATKPAAKPKRTASKIPNIAQVLGRLGRMIPKEELRRIPKDLSSQVDHYVYGTPKR